MQIKKISFSEIVKPLKTSFSTSLGRKNVIKSVIVKVFLKDGSYGIGEIPTSFVLKKETIPVIKSILKEVSPRFINLLIADYEDKIPSLRKRFFNFPLTISGLEAALFRASLKEKNITEHKYWGGKLTELETDITIPFIMDEVSLRKWMNYILRKKFRIYKLKVSGNVERDKHILSLVYSILKDNVEKFILRLDGNQGYNGRTFLRFMDFIEKNNYKIELFEQPLKKKDYKGFKFIKKRSFLPIILDETVFTYADLEYAIKEDLAWGVNIKIAKSGISETIKIMETATKYNLKLMIGCMTETIIGLSTAVYLALGTAKFDFIDLDSIYFLRYNKQYDKLLIRDCKFIITSS